MIGKTSTWRLGTITIGLIGLTLGIRFPLPGCNYERALELTRCEDGLQRFCANGLHNSILDFDFETYRPRSTVDCFALFNIVASSFSALFEIESSISHYEYHAQPINADRSVMADLVCDGFFDTLFSKLKEQGVHAIDDNAKLDVGFALSICAAAFPTDVLDVMQQLGRQRSWPRSDDPMELW